MRSDVRRTLERWTPHLGTLENWLEELRLSGWVPEYPWEPTPVVVNGRTVCRYVLIDAESFDRGLAHRQPDVSG
jgi:hypothetical protein